MKTLFIMLDSLNRHYLPLYGGSQVQTPNIDSVARRGVTMTNADSGSPVCVPGRASMMTGLYANETNSFCNSTVWDGSQPTWAVRLREAGYDCCATGKLDLNDDFDLGFKETDTKNGHHTNPDITSLFRNPLIYRADERSQVDGSPRVTRHHDSDLASTAVDFIRSNSPSDIIPVVSRVSGTCSVTMSDLRRRSSFETSATWNSSSISGPRSATSWYSRVHAPEILAGTTLGSLARYLASFVVNWNSSRVLPR